MNKTWKVVLLFCIALPLCFFILTACKQKEPPVEQPQETETQQHSHAFGEWEMLKAPTCTEKGVQQSVCSCGEKLAMVVNATGHVEGDWIDGNEPTCTENGTKYRACTKCHVVLNVNKIPALGHKEGEWVVTREPTCAKSGSKELFCVTCGESLDRRAIPKPEHTEVVDAAVAPTCTEDGLTEGKHCSVCETVIIEQKVIKASHTWLDYEGDAEYHWRTCKVCNETEPKAMHNMTNEGYCADCNRLISDVIGLAYQVSSDSSYAEVIGYTGSLTMVMIADQYEGLPVHVIANSAFNGCENLESITIPNSVIRIGDSAFYGCTGLTEIRYSGSQKEWDAIEKGDAWNESTGSYTIIYNYQGD